MAERITGHTELIGLIATPIRHSSSPRMHNEAFAKLGLDYAYLAFEVGNEELEDTIKGFRAMKVRGSNVSMPNKTVSETKLVDLVDVELFTGDEIVKDIVETAHNNGVKVVMSNHDFFKTPAKEEIISRLCKMQDLGADLPKIAVMPNTSEDVVTLLAATEEMSTKHANRPIITMSMGGLGLVSRLAGETFGSALTFGAAKAASAPGQISVDKLATILEVMHESR